MTGRVERTRLSSTLLVGVGAALVPAAIGIAFLGRYGWDRDELYFLAASTTSRPTTAISGG